MLVQMYHPLIPSTSTNPARVALSSVDDHAARGWLLVDPDVIPPAPETPYPTRAEADSRYVARTAVLDNNGKVRETVLPARLSEDAQRAAFVRVVDGQLVVTVDGVETVVGSGGAPAGGINPEVQEALDALAASQNVRVIGIGPYVGAAPDRPTVAGAFGLWNGDIDPGAKAVDGDLGVGW